jgi:hypothetical protein
MPPPVRVCKNERLDDGAETPHIKHHDAGSPVELDHRPRPMRVRSPRRAERGRLHRSGLGAPWRKRSRSYDRECVGGSRCDGCDEQRGGKSERESAGSEPDGPDDYPASGHDAHDASGYCGQRGSSPGGGAAGSSRRRGPGWPYGICRQSWRCGEGRGRGRRVT